MKKFKKGDFVRWLFSDSHDYEIVATKEEPHVTESGEKIEVSEGNDFVISKTPLEDGKFGAFQHVPMQHLEFMS